jgi:molybdopterin-guanine dinucleotide biosynthesis protein A
MRSLAGKPMIQHVIQRMMDQTEPLLVSVQDNQSEVNSHGLVSVPDLIQRHRGPLTGLCSAMQYLQEFADIKWLLMCPCDAPFVPRDLAVRLYRQAQQEEKRVSVVRYEQVIQPTFSLWNLSVFPQVYAAVTSAGRGGLMYMLDHIPHAEVDWEQGRVPPFFNVNSSADLVIAERLLDPGKARTEDRRFTAED